MFLPIEAQSQPQSISNSGEEDDEDDRWNQTTLTSIDEKCFKKLPFIDNPTLTSTSWFYHQNHILYENHKSDNIPTTTTTKPLKNFFFFFVSSSPRSFNTTMTQLLVLSILLLNNVQAQQMEPNRVASAAMVIPPSSQARSVRSDDSIASSSTANAKEHVEIKPLSREVQGNPGYNYYVTSNTHGKVDHEHDAPTRYQVAKFDFEHVSTPYIISMWIIIVGLAKIGFHVTPKLSSICPESVVLMILGVAIGLVMYLAGIPEESLQPLTPNLFFLYMLPPIVMDAGYHMPNRLFFDNLVTILLYAVVGTIWNALAIGLSLYGCSKLGAFGDEIPFLDIMLFSSTVSAVDPVAVLAVFEEIHVNEVLYILVFGESLLNDAVTVVLYHMFEGYANIAYHHGISSISTIDYVAGAASFFVVALGGTAMGVFWGFLAAFVSRFTHHVKIIEPIFVFVMAYLSYLSAEMFHLSGILSLTFCGITMKNYVEENITQKSHTTLKYAMKMLANSSEAIIFVFLGVCTVNDQHKWNTAFVVLTIIFCLVYRAIGVICLTMITNRFRLHRVNAVEQFIMAYGGLRGAVAFALILIINRQIIHAREMFVTTIIAVVYFTVFLQGMTVGALVNILKVPRSNKFQLTMNERIHTRLMDHAMAGLEDISGIMVMGNYKMRDKFRYYNNHYLRKWLLRDASEMGNSSRKIFETCSRLDLQDAMSLVSKQQLLYTTTGVTVGGGTVPPSNHLTVNRYLYYNGNGKVVNTKPGMGVDLFTKSDDDNDRNNNNGNDGQGPPSIFLTVPTNIVGSGFDQVPFGPDDDPSKRTLTAILRSFTKSDLSEALKSDDDEQPIISNGVIPSTGTNMDKDFNYDIGNLSYSPSLKDLTDAELHHVLSEAMFKPFKHVNHYTRSDYSEPQPAHPPFQHQVRMQIRKFISEKKSRGHHGSHGNDHDHQMPSSGTGGNSRNKIENRRKKTNGIPSAESNDTKSIVIANKMAEQLDQDTTRQSDKVMIEMKNRSSKKKHNDKHSDNLSLSSTDDDDGGIMFIAKSNEQNRKVGGDGSGDSDPNDVKDLSQESNKSEVVSQSDFPWRQQSTPIGDGGASGSDQTTSPGGTETRNRRTDSRTSTSSRSSDDSGAINSGNAISGGTSTSAHHRHDRTHQHHHHHNRSHHHQKRSKLKDGVIRQREFPSWIENRDYVTDYISPTSTLLERINLLNSASTNQTMEEQRSQSTKPTVYEIFQLDKSKSDPSIQNDSPPSPAPNSETTFPIAKPSTTTTTTTPIGDKTIRSKSDNDNEVVIQFYPTSSSSSSPSSKKTTDTKANKTSDEEAKSRQSKLTNKDDKDDNDDDDYSIMISKL